MRITKWEIIFQSVFKDYNVSSARNYQNQLMCVEDWCYKLAKLGTLFKTQSTASSVIDFV